MTIGTGVFLSSVILALIALYAITKDRWNWRRLVKRVGLGIVTLVFIAATAIAAYYFWDQFPAQVSRQTEYAGIRLGMSPDEVMYIKGRPPQVLSADDPKWKDFLFQIDAAKLENGKTVKDYRYWNYPTDKSYVTVEFNSKRTAVIAIQCYSADKLNRCPSVAGIRDGDTEQEAIRKLGSAGEQKFQGTAKSITYANLGIRLHLTQEQVYMIQVSSADAAGLLVPSPNESKP